MGGGEGGREGGGEGGEGEGEGVRRKYIVHQVKVG